MFSILYLISHQWKDTRRSPMWQRNMVINIILGVLILFMILNFLFLGLLADKALLELFPEKNPVDVFDSGLLYYFGIEMFIRFWIQSLPGMNIIPYLHLPVRRATLMHYLLGRSLSSPLNYVSFLIFIPFAAKAVAGTYAIGGACCWLLTMLLCVTFANLTVVYIKRQLTSKIWIALAWIAVFALLFVADYLNIFSLSGVSGRLFGAILTTPWFVLVPALLVAGLYLLNYRFLLSHAYPEEYSSHFRQGTAIANLRFANRFGIIGRAVAIELKLILRNKRTRGIMILFTLFTLFYGSLFGSPHTPFLLQAAWCVLSPGLLMLGYAQMPFDGRYFDSIQTRNTTTEQYIKAKYILFIFLLFIGLALSIPSIIIYKPNFIGVFLSGFLFNIGVISFIYMYSIGFARESMVLSKGTMMNYQGQSAYQYVTMFATIAIILLPVLIGSIFGKYGIYFSLAIPGTLGILFTKPLLNICTRHVARQKYAMAEGFRQRR